MSMSVVRCCGAQVLPRNQCLESTNGGRTRWPNPLQRGGRVEFAERPALQYRICVSAVYSRDSPRRSQAFPSARVATFQVLCCGPVGETASDSAPGRGVNSDSSTRGLLRIAALIGSATAVSKLLGLIRETILAAVFGVGPVINAFSYASIIPGFFLTVLGGINGPFHSAVAASLSKRPKEEGRYLVQRLTMITTVVCGAISLAIFLLAGPLVDAIAPGLTAPGYVDGLLTRRLAIIQLKIMAPCAMLAALVGIGFGALSTAGIYGIPSLSPALSSMSILLAISSYLFWSQQISSSSVDVIAAAVSLAVGTTVGALGQWGLQAQARHRAGFGPLQNSRKLWKNLHQDKGVHEVFTVLLPAAIASGMLQIATYTDLYFSSFIPGAAAALGYANLLAMAPLGILSSSILVPLLPTFSRLSSPSSEQELQELVRQGLLLSMVLTVFMTVIMVSLAGPIVRVVFQHRAFDALASMLVSSLLICYSLGSSFHLARDILVYVFYALGDGGVPFQISTAAICANAFLDWLLVRYAGYGVHGLVLATSLVNCGSAVALLIKLSSKLKGLQLRYWTRPLLLLGCSGFAAGIISRYAYTQLSLLFITTMQTVKMRNYWAADVASLVLASGVGLVVYCSPLLILPFPEMNSVIQLL